MSVHAAAAQCPKCHLPMQALTHGGVALSHCVECQGLWFDGEEVSRVIGPAEVGPFRAGLTGERSRATPLPCARGHGRLREVTLELPTDRADACGCPDCLGVWMEARDLRRIRPHLPQADVASDERIEALELRLAEAQHQADDAKAARREAELPPMLFLMQAPLAPLKIYSAVRRRPLVTYTLITANAAVFGLQWVSGGLFELALVPAWFLQGLQPWTILTAMFLHGDVFHLLGNMYFLAVFGDNVEDRVGVPRYLILYLLGGFGASLAHIAADAASTIPTLGASGAISAVMGAYVALFPHRKLYVTLFVVMRRVRAVWFLAVWLAFQFYYAFQGAPGVAWWAHIGGVAVGAGLAAVHRAMIRRRLQAAQAV